MSEMRERRRRGELYLAGDPDSRAEYGRVQELLARFNTAAPGADDERRALLGEMLQQVGQGVTVRAPFYCEFGAISIGAGSFVNFDVVMLDVCPIAIGPGCQIGPRVQLLTPAHPVDPQARRAGWEYGAPITVEENVWLGGGAIVCPGVTIGQDTVVGAGAVVTGDLPAGVVATGVPARVLRSITDADRVVVPSRPSPVEPSS